MATNGYSPFIYNSKDFTINDLNRLVKSIKQDTREKSRRHIMGDRECKIGDIIIAARYYEGYGVIKLKIIGETKLHWKVEALSNTDYYRLNKIQKSDSVYILESNG